MATHYFPSHHGGVEIVAERLFRGLAARGHEIVWIAGNSSEPPKPVGSSHPVSLKILNFVEDRTGVPVPVPTFSALRSIGIEVSRADAVILHDSLYLTNIAAYLLAKIRRVPVLLIQHVGFIPYGNPVPKFLMRVANSVFTRSMLSRAEQVVFVSETTKECFAGLKFKNVPEIIFHGVDTELYHPARAKEEKSALRAKYGLPHHCPIILFIGRFVEIKGLSILKRMVKERPDWTWVFAGRQGPLDPGRWNASNVRVLSGPPDDTVAELYRASDLLVLPSRYEAFSLVVREALSSGLPVVSTPDVSRSDPAIACHIQEVPIYPDDDLTAREFLFAVETLLESDATSSIRSDKRHAFAEARYSWDRAVDRYAGIVSHLTPRTGTRHEPIANSESERI